MKKEQQDDMVQSAVRLPRSLHERLKKAGGDRGMGDEIRRRLEASFAAEKNPESPNTRELINAISFFDEELVRDFGSWSKDRFAFEVFRESINALLKQYEPKGELVPAQILTGWLNSIRGKSLSRDTRSVPGGHLDKRSTEAQVCRKEEALMKGHIRERSPGHWAIIIIDSPRPHRPESRK